MPYVGVSLGFIVGPLLLRPSDFPAGCAVHPSGSASETPDSGSQSSGSDAGQAMSCAGAAKLHMLYYAEACWAIVVCVAIIAYFPAKPPLPPTKSAASAADRQESRSAADGLRQTLCECSVANCKLWAVAIAFALPLGVYSVSRSDVIALLLASYADSCL
eukprot:SAG31_NODE_6045_length_2193_cov_0.862942_4_plen_160_part_00